MANQTTFLNPDSMLKNPAFSQIAVAKGPGTTVYIGGQNAMSKDLQIMGKGNIADQTAYILQNIETALKAAGAELNDLVKLTIYIVQGQDVQRGFAGARPFLEKLKNPPVITGVIVAGLAHPDYLVEIEAVAFYI